MNRKYYLKHFSRCFCLLSIASAFGYFSGASLFEDSRFVTLILLSTLMYPFSRYLITSTACTVTGPAFWKKSFFTKGDVSGISALFMFTCLAFAIPLGVCYLACASWRRGGASTP